MWDKFNPEPPGLTSDELARVLQVPKKEIDDYLKGITVWKDSKGKFIIPYEDVQNARLHFLYKMDVELDSRD